MTSNNDLYAQVDGSRATEAGLSEDLDWSICSIGDHQPTRCGLEATPGDNWMITAYNPSTVA